MGDCAPTFNPLSQLSKVANNSNSFVHKHLNKPQNDFSIQRHQQSKMNSSFNSGLNMQHLNSSMSNVSISSTWNQEYKDYKNLDRSVSMRSSDMAVNNSMLNLQKSMTPVSLESTPGLRLMNSSPMYSRQHSMMNMVKMEQQHINEQWESKFEEHESKLMSEDLHNNESISKDIYKEDTLNIDKFEQVWNDVMEYSDLLRRQSAYKLSSENKFKDIPNAYEIGIEILKQGGKLADAIECFESAVQQNDNHIEAWVQLGLCQIKNENEWQGITALETVIKQQEIHMFKDYNDRNIDVTIELATCYINVGMDLMAFKLFDEWINKNYDKWADDYQRYQDSKMFDLEDNDNEERSINQKLMDKYSFVSKRNPLVLNDKGYQLILGLLSYCLDDYDSNVQSFQRALELDASDEILWNRLGATMANHGKYKDAVHAYKEALRIKPSFVRARYNLGISLMNIGWFKESVECFLSCCKLQTGESISIDLVKSHSILDNLSSVFVSMNRIDLLDKLNAFKEGKVSIDVFNREFNF
ncbi:uncharacterized protein HGUI_02791 [Hanseniaspora guilliermondii]|uniref:Peroxin-5 n=1 Tax=Hanseniaspora guilliermondii TaxID=56406 RepID=A0A1L0D0F9_9ASCO|nr:uncharacterized protein HGUI_02791 [Hanseniaspora guilliermondii]